MLGVVRGRVFVEQHHKLRPLALAHVEVIGGANIGLAAVTATDGSYELTGLRGGDAVIQARKSRHGVAERSILILPGENRLSLSTPLLSPPNRTRQAEELHLESPRFRRRSWKS
jgi:hypothetical protein